jgi:hypothetical protein
VLKREKIKGQNQGAGENLVKGNMNVTIIYDYVAIVAITNRTLRIVSRWAFNI